MFDAEGNGYLLLSQKLYRSAWSREISFSGEIVAEKGGAIYATTFLDLMTIEVKLLSIELPAVTSPVQQALSQPRHSCSVVDARRAAARASTILASERGWADRADPAAHLCRVLLVHVEKVGHRRTD